MAGPTLFRPSDIATGLVGYWKLDEANGTRADSSGNGNDLTDNNTVTSVAQDYWKTGENSADFEAGNSEYLSIASGSQTGLNLTGSFSLVAWIKPESDVSGYIYSRWAANVGYGFARVSGGALRILIGATTITSTPTPLSVGRWTHVCAVFDTTNDVVNLYVDGNLIHTAAHSTDPVSGALAMELGRLGGGSDYYDGVSKDAAIWNVALTPIQIKSLALGVDLETYAYRPGNVSTLPTAWWKMNELSGNRADSIGALTLTDNNTVTALGGYIEGVGADFEAGNSEYLSSADNTAFDFSGGIFSVAAWIKPESLAADTPFYCNLTDGSNFLRIGYLTTGVIECLVYSGGGAVVNVTTAAGAVKVGTWHHVAVTENGDTWKIYIDGVDATNAGGTDTSRAANYTGQLEIGRRQDASAFFDGVISDLAIWKGYALTAAEIASLACAIPLQQTGIVSYWKLDETSGTRADSIGSNDLTDNNTVLYGTGKVDNAADFEDANSEYLSGADSADFDFGADGYSISKWIYFESVGSPRIWSIGGNYASGKGLQLGYSGGTLTLYNNGNAGTTDLFTWTPSSATWYHLSIVRDGANVNFKVNSAQHTSSANTDVIDGSTGGMTLGVWSGTLNNYLDGLMDEFVLTHRWFRDEEIKTIYCKGLAGKELTSEEIVAGGSTGNFFLMF